MSAVFLTNRVVLLAAAFYGFFGAGAWLWNLVAGRVWWQLLSPVRPLLEGMPLTSRVGFGLATGTVLGLAVVLLTGYSLRYHRWSQQLYAWFATLLGEVSWLVAVVLALLSGIGEELFFRGAMLPSLGLWMTSAIFALLHMPPRLSLATWTLAAFLLGLAFGWITIVTGNLAGAVTGHVFVNLFNLRQVGGQKVAQEFPTS